MVWGQWGMDNRFGCDVHEPFCTKQSRRTMARITETYLPQTRRIVDVHLTRVGVIGILQPSDIIITPEDLGHRLCSLDLVNRGLRRCCRKTVKRKIARDPPKMPLNTGERYDKFNEPTARPQYVV